MKHEIIEPTLADNSVKVHASPAQNASAGILSKIIRYSFAAVGAILLTLLILRHPFVGRRLKIDPIRRLKHAAIVDRPVKGARRVLRKGGRAVERGTRSLGRAIRKISPF